MLGLTRLRIINLGPRHQRLQHIAQHLRVRTRSQGAILRPAQLGCRDHLHGLGDLPRVDHAANPPPYIENVCHWKPLLALSFWLPTLCASFQAKSQRPQPKAYFATASREATNCCFASLITFCNWPFNASSRIFFSMIVRSSPGLVASTYL